MPALIDDQCCVVYWWSDFNMLELVLQITALDLLSDYMERAGNTADLAQQEEYVARKRSDLEARIQQATSRTEQHLGIIAWGLNTPEARKRAVKQV